VAKTGLAFNPLPGGLRPIDVQDCGRGAPNAGNSPHDTVSARRGQPPKLDNRGSLGNLFYPVSAAVPPESTTQRSSLVAGVTPSVEAKRVLALDELPGFASTLWRPSGISRPKCLPDRPKATLRAVASALSQLGFGVALAAMPVLGLCPTSRQKRWRSQWHPIPKSSVDKALG